VVSLYTTHEEGKNNGESEKFCKIYKKNKKKWGQSLKIRQMAHPNEGVKRVRA